ALWLPNGGRAEAQSEAAETLQRVYKNLQAADPNGQLAKDGMYSLTYGNTLPRDWLLDTPRVWGMNASQVPVANQCELCNLDFMLERCLDESSCTGGTRCVSFPAANKGPGEALCVG